MLKIYSSISLDPKHSQHVRGHFLWPCPELHPCDFILTQMLYSEREHQSSLCSVLLYFTGWIWGKTKGQLCTGTSAPLVPPWDCGRETEQDRISMLRCETKNCSPTRTRDTFALWAETYFNLRCALLKQCRGLHWWGWVVSWIGETISSVHLTKSTMRYCYVTFLYCVNFSISTWP